MSLSLETIYERILLYLVLIGLCVIFVPLTIFITVLIASIIGEVFIKSLLLFSGLTIGFAISFILLHYIFRLSRRNVILKTIIYLALVFMSFSVFIYVIDNIISIPDEYKIINLFLFTIVSYESSSMIYKLLAKTSIIDKIYYFRKSKEQEDGESS